MSSSALFKQKNEGTHPYSDAKNEQKGIGRGSSPYPGSKFFFLRKPPQKMISREKMLFEADKPGSSRVELPLVEIAQQPREKIPEWPSTLELMRKYIFRE